MADEENKTPEEGEAKPKSKMMLFIIIGVVVLLASVGGSIMFLGGSGEDEQAEGEGHEEEELEVHYQIAELDTIIVNLSENSSFLKVKMLIEYDPNLAMGAMGGAGGGHGGGAAGGGGEPAGRGGMPGVMGEREPMIKDAIIRVLSSKTAAEVLSPEGKDDLKEELIEAINDATGLDEGPVVNIYFVEFIIQ